MGPKPTVQSQLKSYDAFTLTLGERPSVAVPLEGFPELTAGRDGKTGGQPMGCVPPASFMAEPVAKDFRSSRLEAGLTQAQLAARRTYPGPC